MIIGYARVATATGDIKRQMYVLGKFGCQKIYSDIGTRIKLDRSSYSKMMLEIQRGDVVMVYRLDRLSRNPFKIREIVRQLYAKGIGFVSLKERINTTTGENTFLFGI